MDNGKYFTSTDFQNFATSSGIYWKFNTESAPWYGSFFEHFVKSVNHCLKKELGKARIDYDEKITLLKEIGNFINNRPISYNFESDLIEPITPNKLLYGRNLEVINIAYNTEYLTELRKHQRRSNKNKTLILPKVNNVVLIKDDNYKWSYWKVGRTSYRAYLLSKQSG